MLLHPGAHLGPYEVTALLGAGGMGEVYKANDTRLNRTVALKVLPHHLRDAPELKQRFEREAKALAALSHAHICPVFDVGQQDGIDFIVMEYLEGETLASRLERGALPLVQALAYAIEIAEALVQAHRKGIVHRDLKPGNVMLTREGSKLLDFGLAKLRVADGPIFSHTAAHTATVGLTGEQTIVGTLPYMAPEQVQGDALDARSDIFSFGAVLYEMVTGKRAFAGHNQAGVIAAVLKDDPAPISSLRSMTPLALDRIVRTCLAKDPDERWQSATDLRRELRWLTEAPGPDAVAPRASVWSSPVVWALVGLLVVVSSIAIAMITRPDPPLSTQAVTGPQRFSIALPEAAPLVFVGDAPLGVGQPALALSPDGSRLVYVGRRGAEVSLYLRPMSSTEATLLEGTEGAYAPFFSADGNWIGFFAGNYLKKLSVTGGAPVTLTEVDSPQGAAWAPDGGIYVSANQASQLLRVPEDGGPAQTITNNAARRGRGPMRWPQLLPGGEALIFAAGNGVSVIVLKTLEEKVLLETGGPPRYVPTGHLVFPRSGQLMAVAFDPVALEVRGPAVPVLDGVRTESLEVAQFTTAPDGTLIYAPGTRGDLGRLVWGGLDGAVRPLSFPPGRFAGVRLSPSGRELAINVLDVTRDIWIYDLERESRRRFGVAGVPLWVPPDGRRLTYQMNGDIFWKNADGSGEAESLVAGPGIQRPETWSPDGRSLIFVDGPDLKVLTLHPERTVTPLVTGIPLNATFAQFSPDGKWVALTRDETGQDEVIVKAFPPTAEQWQISTGGGGNEEPQWSPDGKRLYYRRGRTWMVVDIVPGAKFNYRPPRVAFRGDFLNVPGISYSMAPDGQRFLMVSEQGLPTAASLHVVRNWFTELERLAPSTPAR